MAAKSASALESEYPDTNALLRELLAEVRALRASIEHATGEQPRDHAAGDLVRAIAIASRGALFSVTELLEHAQVVPDLRSAIVKSVGALNGKRLGKLLARIDGVDFDGGMVVRAGANREGVLWLCGFQNRKAVVAR